MALVKCMECGGEVSDKAAACPRCGAPPTLAVEASPVPAASPAKPWRNTAAAWIGGFGIVAIAVGAVAALMIMRGGPSGLPPTLESGGPAQASSPAPWVDRADVELRSMLNEGAGATVAQAIQRITHPTGSGASLEGLEIRHVGIALSVRLSVRWTGGLGAEHTTVVAWNLNGSNHGGANVLADSSPIPIARSNARQLDQYFANDVYPILRSRLGQ